MTMLLALFVINRSHGLVARADDPETTEASISITWTDENDQDGMRPSSVSVDLYAGDDFKQSVSLNSDNEWRQTVSGLSVSENGNQINYSWRLSSVPEGYEKVESENKSEIILTYIREMTEASVSINWIDDNNRRGARPESVSVNLLANGDKCDYVVLNAANEWKAAKVDLVKKRAGSEINYSWEIVTGGISDEYHESAREINGTDTTISMTMVPKRGNLRLLAADKDNNTIKLSGAQIRLYSDIAPSASAASVTKNGKVCYEVRSESYVSDSNGIISINDLEYGKYYIECVGAPSGYHLPDIVWSEKNVDGNTGKETDLALYYAKEAAVVSLSDAVVILSQSEYEYTGKAIEPNVMVTLGDKTLIEGIDYIVSYVNNINVASMKASKNPPTVIITGIGNYTGETYETFSISVTDITKKNDKSEYFCKITFDKVSYVYNGSECKPSPKVTMNGVTLKKDTDYTVSYSNNIDVGAKGSTNSYPIATIKGKGIYTGTRAFSFKITARSLKDAVINLDKGKTVNYTGNEINNPISSVTLSGKTLKEGTDYEVDSSSRLKATASGSYSVKINGKGNYNESASTTWSIRNTASTSTSTTTSGTNTNSSNSGSDYVSSTTKRSSSSSTKPSGTTTGSNTSKTASGNSVSGNKTGKATTGGSSSSSAGGRSVSGNAVGRDAADTVESTGSVSDDSVSANTFPDGEIKKESYGNSGGLKKFTYDGSRNGVIENILTPAPGYENDPPVTGAVDDIAAVGEALMAGDFKEAVEDGAELEVWVDVQPAEDTVSEEEKSLAEKYIMSITDKVAGLCIGRYLDVNVFFRVDRGVWEEVEKTNVPIAVDFSAPDSMKAQSDRFYVLCIHDGKVELLSDINSDPDMITVMTQWLQATYVLLYQDVDAAAAGEIYGPSQASFYTEHDSFDFTAKAADKPKHTPPKFLAISWFMSSFLVLGGYGIYEALKDKEAFKAMLDSLPKRRQTSKTA